MIIIVVRKIVPLIKIMQPRNRHHETVLILRDSMIKKRNVFFRLKLSVINKKT